MAHSGLITGKDLQDTLHPHIMTAQESYIGVDVLNDLIASLLNCRDPKLVVTMLKSLVPEFDHGRDNDKIENAS
ncbi:hypothetical protein [Parasphingorhabdus sp.]|jgi:hypothetical protein|uniref:hypothetical protein n=1 Tax=Parasphingorhabdus sp. TaxID=2709688 RepID=UPI0030A5B2F5|nr:hypothetical protein [Sphingomonadales bacterium]